jgi:hypothetical protein
MANTWHYEAMPGLTLPSPYTFLSEGQKGDGMGGRGMGREGTEWFCLILISSLAIAPDHLMCKNLILRLLSPIRCKAHSHYE